MPQLFPRSANDIARGTIILGLLSLGLVVSGGAVLNTSGYRTGAGAALHQPVPFSHDHHTAALGIDCRYCHTTVETSAFAGVPATQVCINCHKQIWTNAELLEPVRESFRSGEPIQWERVHDLPDFVYFNHSVHIAQGVGCYSCHGAVNEMPLIRQVHSLDMQWCLDCHREPEKFVRPREEVFNMNYRQPPDQEELGRRLVEEYGIESLTSCSVCHR